MKKTTPGTAGIHPVGHCSGGAPRASGWLGQLGSSVKYIFRGKVPEKGTHQSQSPFHPIPDAVVLVENTLDAPRPSRTSPGGNYGPASGRKPALSSGGTPSLHQRRLYGESMRNRKVAHLSRPGNGGRRYAGKSSAIRQR